MFAFVVQFILMLAFVKLIAAKYYTEEESERLGRSILANVPRVIAGIPEIGVDKLDPLLLPNVNFNISGYQLNFTNGVVFGLSKATNDYVKVDLKKGTMDRKTSNLNAFIRGHHVSTGTILGKFPIYGEGEMTIDARSMDVYTHADFRIEVRDGKKYAKFTGNSYYFYINEKVILNITNICDRDDRKTTETLNYINENWREMTSEYSKPIMDAFIGQIYRSAATFFNAVSFEEIYAHADQLAQIYPITKF